MLLEFARESAYPSLDFPYSLTYSGLIFSSHREAASVISPWSHMLDPFMLLKLEVNE